MAFNPHEHLMKLQGKDYLEVKWRLTWFRDQCPEGTIDTEEMCIDLDREVEEETMVWNNDTRRKEKVVKHARGYARFRAVVTDGKGGRATGTKSENAASFPDYIEKAETGSIGRALAALGFGTQFVGDEFDEGHRIVDSPVESRSSNSTANTGNTSTGNNRSNNASERKSDVTVSSLRARVEVVKPTSSKGETLSFEQLYQYATKKPFSSDDEVSPEVCQRINQQLDAIVRARANKQQTA
jgi:hypothetical protein